MQSQDSVKTSKLQGQGEQSLAICENLFLAPFSSNIDSELKAKNPLLNFEGIPKYEQIMPEHVLPAVQELVAVSERILKAHESYLANALLVFKTTGSAQALPSWSHFGAVLEELGLASQRIMGTVGHLVSVSYSEELNKAKEVAEPLLVDFQLKLGQSEIIFEALSICLKEAENGNIFLSNPQKRALNWRLLAAKNSGVGLNAEQKEEFNRLQTRVATLESQFATNVLESTKTFVFETSEPKDVIGIPASILQMALTSGATQSELGPWKFNFDGPTRMAISENARNPMLRRWVGETGLKVAAEGQFSNQNIMLEIVQIRARCSQMLGYPDYAHESLASKAAASPATVSHFSHDVLQKAFQKCTKELDELRGIASEYGLEPDHIAAHDVLFLFERLREKKFDFSSEEMRCYFPFPRVLDGLKKLCERYFKFTFFEAKSEENFPKWHKDVLFFHVCDWVTGEKIASFYIDPYARTGLKQSGAWANEIWPRHARRIEDKETVVLPVGLLVCNGTEPTLNSPSLMSISEVETLLHEFGHLMQFMLARVDIPSVAGFSGIEWDVVEVASQFMENWLYEKEGMQLLSCHYQTGETLPESLFKKFVSARSHGRGWQVCRQLKFGMFDMELFSKKSVLSVDEIIALAEQIRAKTIPLKMDLRDTSPCSFSHIFAGGYAAGYYGYMWADVWSADAFAALLEARDSGGDDAMQRVGFAYRQTFLGVGGGLNPQLAFENFRGRKPSPAALFEQMGI